MNDNRFTKLLRGLSFVDEDLLSNCSDYAYKVHNYIGLTIFLTGVLATVSMTFAMSTLTDSVLVALLIGTFWGVIVISFDRGILLSTSNGIVFLRMGIAVLIGFIVSLPLEMKIMEDKILERMDSREKVFATETQGILKAELKDYQKEKQRILKNIRTEEDSVAKFNSDMVGEKGGVDPRTGKRIPDGEGARFKMAKSKKERHSALLENYRKELSNLEAQHKSNLDLHKKHEKLKPLLADKFVERYIVLSELEQETDDYGEPTQTAITTGRVSLGLKLLFILIEIFPAILKLTLPRTDYEPYHLMIAKKNVIFERLLEVKMNAFDSEIQAKGSSSGEDIIPFMKDFLSRNKI